MEIQLRTPGQHEWAEAVERIAARSGFLLKDGEGPPELLTYFDLAAWGIAVDEAGEEIDERLMPALIRLRERVDRYFTGSE